MRIRGPDGAATRPPTRPPPASLRDRRLRRFCSSGLVGTIPWGRGAVEDGGFPRLHWKYRSLGLPARSPSVEQARPPESAPKGAPDESTVRVLRDVMTHAEKTFAEYANDDAVTHMRQPFQKTMEADYTNAVERPTSRKVIAFVNGNNPTPTSRPDSSSSTAPCTPQHPRRAPPPQTTRTTDGCSPEGKKLKDATASGQTRPHSPPSQAPGPANAGSPRRAPLAPGGEPCS